MRALRSKSRSCSSIDDMLRTWHSWSPGWSPGWSPSSGVTLGKRRLKIYMTIFICLVFRILNLKTWKQIFRFSYFPFIYRFKVSEFGVFQKTTELWCLVIWSALGLSCYTNAVYLRKSWRFCDLFQILSPSFSLFGGAAAAFFCTTNRGKLLQRKLIHVHSVLKKVLEYQYPLYRSTGTRFKKLFLSIVFTILKKS